MDKLKKVGISALAGTLATLSAAQAGSLSVSGSAAVTYVQNDSDEVTGNPIGMSKDITFNGSGELDNGWTVSVMHDLTDAAAWASSSLSIGMGSLGTLIIDQDTGADMGSALDNVVPTAFEEADAGMGTGMKLSGAAIDPSGSIVYKLPVISGAQIGFAYQPRSGAAVNADGGTSGNATDTQGEGFEYAVDWSPEMVPGLRVGGAIGKCSDCGAGTKDTDEETWFATYAYGPLSIGYQVADIDDGTNTFDTDIYGVSFNINDSLSVSYQYGETDGSAATYTTAEFTGISAAYNIGPMAIKFTDNSGKNINGAATDDDDNRELNLSMSF
jgi:outer membrane protein OmpU